ncbi:ABC transporter ATP-binding protein [Tepidibacter hydrothermalis]|uniref:ABC transporter ATP-binding protein n=1 Tax=Tepidibacter hydrothermalis TaxID=3036126 RepID=A0ABY8EDX4_9FIRM|nr:ABC transporter ATP-binding protein [Tepidibacter hydrothermalis]WFD11148.1 ABC transporter ATP-binding protein [Tepidibacter hydrothermalis]
MYIDIKNLDFNYKNSKEKTIDNFSIDIKKGEIIAILGESGSGKSTILRLISGLEIPSSGHIKVDNRVLVDKNNFIQPEKRGVGMVFQDYALFPHMTVGQNIKFGLKDMKSKEKEIRVNEVLNLVDLEGYKKRYPHELSGGQQQRIALARALAPRPSLLLMDEPFSNLDANLKGKIREELKKIIDKSGITSIFVTHDKEDAINIAHRVIILKEGELVKVGSPKEIL